ncbi:MAG: dCMP deaminase family protein [Bacilli bacterium]|nr:dCMP deaminase family protein [Bacilli bacterium]
MKKIDKQRKDYLSWDEYFMAIAKLSSYRSKDPSTRVGACIVDKQNRILSIGYNGAPNGFNDVVFPWERNGGMLETKYAFVCHAEMNAILNYRGSRKDLENAKIYVDLFPCNECAKLIVQSGIKEVIYLSDKFKNPNGEKVEDSDSVKASKMMFDECGVSYHSIALNTDKIVIDLQKN